MKNRILSTILALSLILSSFMLFSVSVAAEGEIVIPKVNNGITLDGNLTEADWTGACNIESAQFKMLWDENYLYVGYTAPYREDMWGGSVNHGGYVGGGEYCTFTIHTEPGASYTNHITVTPNLGAKGSASYPWVGEPIEGAPNLMSFHADGPSAVYYPDNVKINVNAVDGIYTLEAKIPWTEINLDRSQLTAAQGDSFYMQIVRADANVINPMALVVLGEAAEVPELTTIPQGTVTVDGTLNDAEWVGAFFDAENQFKMLWDENFLYVGYVGVYNPETWGASVDHGGFIGGGEYRTFLIMDSLAATAYTNHITVTPNLGSKVNAGTASVLEAPNLMSYHKQDGSGAYYPDNAKINLDEENAIYTIEAKIPWTEINLDRSKLTAAQGDIFYMQITGSGKAVFATTTEVALGEALTPPAPEYDYTASLTGPATGVTVGDEVTFTVNVDNTFAAGEVTLTYDKTLLTPVAGEGIKIDDGIVTVVTYGADKTSVNVVFEAKAAGTAQVALKDAAFSAKEDAATEDLTDAAIETADASVVIAPAEFAVTLPEIFEGNSAVANGSDYTFKAKDTNNYNYALPTATVNGEAATVIDNEDGTYTVKNITGALVITGTRTEKTYNATVTGNGAADVTLPEAKPTYGTDYVLTLPVTNEEYTYTVTVQVGNGEPIPVTSNTYTVAGADITGDIVVNVTKTEIVPETVTVTLAGNANDAVVNFVGTVNKGDAYTLTINPVKGYTYTVTATMGGEPVTLDTSVANAYTVAAATADIEFTVTATLDKSGVAVNEYVQLDGTKMWLVKVTTELADGKTYTYGGNTMYYSEAHGAYVYLVVANELTVDTAKAAVDATTGTAASFATDVAYDVNKSGKTDANDAQLVYNIYNTTYAGITESVTMEKFLLADANADGIVDVADAAAIVAAILA